MSLLHADLQSVTAFAPATCANLAVGFDILGLAFDQIGDSVTLRKREDNNLVIEAIEAPEKLPFDSRQNTATRALQALRTSLSLDQGFSVRIRKGIPLSSGMGGSAASAVAAVLACNAFLKNPLSLQELAAFALQGENAKHADNIAPCLFGGLTLIQSLDPLNVLRLPIPEVVCVLVHPHLELSTEHARNILQPQILLTDYVRQTACLAGFIAALYTQDLQLLQKSYADLLIEPQRAGLLPGFYKIKEAALQAGALGFSFSGSGPSLLALSKDRGTAKNIAQAMQNQLKKEGLASDCWIAPIRQEGAHLTEKN